MTYKDKLIDLLKSDDETREAIEKLEFGTRIILKDYIDEKTINQLIDYHCMEFKVCVLGDKIFTQKDIEKIIGLPLQERFIRMYCKNKSIRFQTQENDVILLRKGSANEYLFGFNGDKDFDNQSEKTYMAIFNALISIK